MTNAKQELLKILKDKSKIKCAYIHDDNGYSFDEDEQDQIKKVILPLNYTEEQLNEFYKKLDFNYDSGYGGQELFGNVWLEDDTWLSRGEYDGSEWWDYKKMPKEPTETIELKALTVNQADDLGYDVSCGWENLLAINGVSS